MCQASVAIYLLLTSHSVLKLCLSTHAVLTAVPPLLIDATHLPHSVLFACVCVSNTDFSYRLLSWLIAHSVARSYPN